MKLFGYFDEDQETPSNLSEVTLQTSSANDLRDIAKFLLAAADMLERKVDFEHLHLQTECKTWAKGEPDIVIYNENKRQ
jgi:hypothetical protein